MTVKSHIEEKQDEPQTPALKNITLTLSSVFKQTIDKKQHMYIKTEIIKSGVTECTRHLLLARHLLLDHIETAKNRR